MSSLLLAFLASDRSHPSALDILVFTTAGMQLAWSAFCLWRIHRGGRLLLELSKPNRKWLWAAGACLALGVAGLLHDPLVINAPSMLLLAHSGFFGLRGGFGEQIREQGITTFFEFVPWTRVSVSWPTPDTLSITINRPMNWNSTTQFVIPADRRAELARLFEAFAVARD